MQFVIVGTGGQGILFASKVLGHVAMERDDRIVGSEVHGMAQRGGSVISYFKIGDYLSPLVKVGDADVLIAFDQNEAVRNLHYLKEDGHLVVNLYDPEVFSNDKLSTYINNRKLNVHSMEGYEILKKHMEGNFLFLNVLILGAMCGAGVGGVSIEDVKSAVKALSPARFVDTNLKVLDLGYEATSR